MASHEPRGSGPEASAKGGQVELLDLLALAEVVGDGEVRIFGRRAVAREVLEHGEGAASMEAFDEGSDQRAHEFGIAAEGSVGDDAVLCVVVDVGDGAKDEIQADRAALGSEDRAGLERGVWVLARTNGHLPGERGAAREAVRETLLAVGPEQDGDARGFARETVEVVDPAPGLAEVAVGEVN